MQHNLSLLLLVCLAAQISKNTVFSVPAPDGDDEEQRDQDQSGRNRVVILSKPETFNVEEGQDVTLPCETNGVDTAALIWMNSTTTLFVDNKRINADENFSVLPSKSLIIKGVTKNKAGTYKCYFDPTQPLIHTLSIKVNVTFPNNMRKVYDNGNNVSLSCVASGYPHPSVTWYKQNEEGRILIAHSANFTLHNVSVSDSGTYECEATNDLQLTPVIKPFAITVVDGVSAQHKIVYAESKDQEASMCCYRNKFADSKSLSWMKDGKELITNEDSRYNVDKSKNNFCLTIKKVKEEDLGIYTCKRLKGSGIFDQANITLSGAPHVPELKEYGTLDVESKWPIMKWNVVTYDPIISVKIFVKKQEDSVWKVYRDEGIITTDPVEKIVQVFSNLPNGQYNVKLEVANKYGSTVFVAKGTPLVIDNMQPSVIMSEKQENAGVGAGASSFKVSSLCILFALLVRLWNRCC